MDKFEDMVEDLELNEDMVECKECFDLFPKAEGVKLEVGYICPTCQRRVHTDGAAAEPDFKLDQFALTNDLYTQEFPDVTEYAPDTTKDWEREPTVMDALDTLIKDEYDAIEAYEEADETIQHLPMDEDEKDDILDTIGHIKEEEEEHIDELKDLTDEDQEDEEDEEDDGDEDEKEIEESADKQTLVESVNLPTWVGYTNNGEFVGAVRAATEEEAYERLEREYACEWVPMGYEPDELMVELAGEGEVFDEAEYLTEAEAGFFRKTLNKLGNKVKRVVNKATKATININEIFSKGYYIHIVGPKKEDIVDANGKPCQNQRAQTLDSAEKIAKGHSVRFNNANVEIIAIKEGVTISDPQIKKLVDKYGWKLEVYNNGKPTTTSGRDDINKRIKELVIANQNSVEAGETFIPIDEVKEELKKELGKIIPPAGYTEESYAEYKEAWDAIIEEIDAAEEAADLEDFDVAAKKEAAEELLEKKDGGLDGDGDEDDVAKKLEEARADCLAILGEKIPPEGYTPESYEQYSKKYDQYKSSIESAKQLKTLTDVYPKELMERVPKLNALLKKANGGGGSGGSEGKEEDTVEDNEDLELLKKMALKALQKGKEKPDAYTEDSYADYESEIQTKSEAIKKATQSSKVQAFIDKLPTWLEKLKALLDPKEEEAPEDTGTEDEDTSDKINELKEKITKAVTTSKDTTTEKRDTYSEASFKDYLEAVEKLLTAVEGCKSEDELKALGFKTLDDAGIEVYIKEKLDSILKLRETGESEDENPEDETPEEDEVNLDEFIEKLTARFFSEVVKNSEKDKYTEESWNAYDEAIVDYAETVIKELKSEEEYKELDAGLAAKIEEFNKLLVLKPAEEENEDFGETASEDLEAERAELIKILNDLRDTVEKEEYTEESYEKFLAAIEASIKKMREAETLETLLDIMPQAEFEEAKKLLVAKDTSDTGDTDTEEEDTEKDTEEEASGFSGKLSELSDVQLARMYSALTGKGVGYTDKSKTKLSNNWHKEMNKLRRKLKGLGENFEREDELLECIRKIIEEDLKSTEDAVAELKDTGSKLKSAAAGMKNMTQAMREEYHKYANPAELKAMEDLEAVIEVAKNDALSSMQNWGIDISESDAQGWMSGNKEYEYQFMLDYEGIDEDEEEDIQDQLQSMIENTVLSQYTLPPELSGIRISVALPDPDLSDDDEGTKRASLFVDVTFARNLL